ncbi:MAG: hypothetical protein DHS20C02_14640 [Micavibrio sp.]|nr:MAG: hypothetical protein DHS20C02_14640 [Micavibrio sp.]
MQVHLKSLLPFIAALLGGFLSSCVNVQEAEYKTPLEAPEDAHPAPIMFSTLTMKLPTGTEIGSLSEDCLWPTPAGRNTLRGAVNQGDLDDVFEEVLEGQGYDVTGSLSLFFPEEIQDEIMRSEYRVGGKVIHAEMDACHEGQPLIFGVPGGRSGTKGEMFLEIEWSVYDALRRRTVHKTTTKGYTEQRQLNQEGLSLMITGAFEMAAHNLGTQQEFHDLIFYGTKPPNWYKKKKHEDRPLPFEAQEDVSINNPPLSRKNFTAEIEDISQIAVLVQNGMSSHGSGFFITPQGHIITNSHVVGDAQRVRIVTKERREKLIAQVLRVDRARDVALLKLEEIPEKLQIMTRPIRTDWPAVSEEIYAIGAPRTALLQDTVTKGIVSAHRKNMRFLGTRQDFIQGDVEIHGGNSGGALLDAHGNIVGITVGAQIAGDGSGIGLNYFIPVGGALEKLGITLGNNSDVPAGFDTSDMAPRKSLNVGPPVKITP